MANQLEKGRTFNPGDTVEAADLNLLVDGATALPAIIVDVSHGVVNAAAGDKALVVRGGALKQTDINTFPQGVTSVGLSMPTPFLITMSAGPNPVVGAGTFQVAFRTQTVGKVLAGPVSGSAAIPTFRNLVPSDLPTGTIGVSATAVDCSLGNVFLKTLAVGTGLIVLHLNNMDDGQTVRVAVNNNPAGNGRLDWAVTPETLIWRGGGPSPPITPVGNAKDIYVFTKISTAVYGYADQDFKV